MQTSIFEGTAKNGLNLQVQDASAIHGSVLGAYASRNHLQGHLTITDTGGSLGPRTLLFSTPAVAEGIAQIMMQDYDGKTLEFIMTDEGFTVKVS